MTDVEDFDVDVTVGGVSVRLDAVPWSSLAEVVPTAARAVLVALAARYGAGVVLDEDPKVTGALASLREKLRPPEPVDDRSARLRDQDRVRRQQALLNRIGSVVARAEGVPSPEHELPDAVSRIANRPSIRDIRPGLVDALARAAGVPSSEQAPNGHGLDVPPASADPAEFVSAVAFAAHRAATYHVLAKHRRVLLERLAALVELDGRDADPGEVVRRLELDQTLLRKFQADAEAAR